MLGKTNITTLSEGGIVTEIEDFSWIRMQSGTYSDITKAIFQNGYLAALTADGGVLFTKDGEYWETLKPDYADCRLNDIDWDGERFLLVGSCTDVGVDENNTIGLILETVDFRQVKKLPLLEYASGQYCTEYFLIFPQNGKYTLMARDDTDLYLLNTNFREGGTACEQMSTGESKPIKEFLHISTAKNTNGAIVYMHFSLFAGSVGETYANKAWEINNGKGHLFNLWTINLNETVATVFECKSALYIQNLGSSYQSGQQIKYVVNKFTDSGELLMVCAEKNFMLKGGAYFDGCELFINSHGMLIVRKEEHLADKTVDDLIEIAPEDTMNCVIKAFGQLYILGKRGLILKSSVEAKNENAILVQELSAKRALEEAKAYADAKYIELEERISDLESQHGNR